MEIDLAVLTPVESIRGDSHKDTELLREMSHTAAKYIREFKWCRGIVKQYLGFGVGGVVAVFLFNIKPSKDDVDRWLWVITGDLPPAYLVVDNSPTPKAALRAYMDEMRYWITAVRLNKDLDSCIPVNVDPTSENASLLESRLNFLQNKILSE